ncbi:DUF58 domain-containing protein [Wenyingzhuangia aestuarii]|uniref:DUF58 domain-containing protein n=1 Tax=Wenyingzhuangia aestuarii TaxID=1647582 RepID=UPI00143B8308|nr:DUF58 domain-containing protein [Wenyingzhuangia aestuarii]NJB81547.1 uncharacterized protein (DUF58 family) [Wenyingzhuangia aestuarii]
MQETSFLNKLKKAYQSIYLNNLFFYLLSGFVVLFVLSFFIKELYLLSQLLFVVFIGIVCFDIYLVFRIQNGIEATRTLPEKLSNGDQNTINIQLKNNYPLDVFIEVIDELPAQFQIRDFSIHTKLRAQSSKTLSYDLVPTERGAYHFGHTHVFVHSILNMVTKKYVLGQETVTKTYPSFLKLKQFDLKTINSLSSAYGIKKVRRIGNSFEFEQIKEYVQGDNIKDINWKATAKKNQLMVNQFVDEKAQNIYMLIDRGRTMKMPFNGLSLLDYAINASLIVSNVVIQKQDKAGLFSFSKNINDYVSAERRNHQLGMILESLYNVKTNYEETDFGILYSAIKQNIRQRSLLLLYTNFDSMDALERQMSYLRAINKSHLLIVIFFKNTEILKLANKKVSTEQEIVQKTVAEKFIYDKELMVLELSKYGVNSILTTPENLTIDSINKYIEIKSKGLI